MEQLLVKASISRSKGQIQEARILLEEARQRAPERADIHELLGDVYHQLGLLEEALACYREAHAREPQRASSEEKMAQVLLAIKAKELPPEVPFAPKNPVLALALSALFPGAGQVYNEQWGKGFAIAVGALSSLYYFLQHYRPLLEAQGTPAAFTIPLGQVFLTVLSGFACLGLWTFGIVDAYRQGVRIRSLQEQGSEKTSQTGTTQSG